jgi:multidrug efflux pump subunit AcrB
VRQAIAPVRGATLPLPYGGKPRQIMVDLDPQSLLSKGLSPLDVGNAVNAQNLTLPSGTSKIGEREFTVSLNSSPDTVAALNDVPIKQVNGSMVYIRDVAHVRDGFAVQTNIVRQDGSPSALLTILKNGGASTLDIVNQIKALLPSMRAAAPPGLEMIELFDQSIFVRAAISGVIKEGVIAALLTATMILLFLGSWRSTFIVMVSIPLSILASLSILSLLGYTLNVMTLGGLALAIGILVDEI